jgi:hypothetical protein
MDTPSTPRKFSNPRDWRGFVSALGCSLTYPNAMDALRAHGAWFVDAARERPAGLGPARV